MNLNTEDYFFDSVDGLRLYCRIYPAKGSARLPVLCLPGLTRNSRDFAALAQHLQPRHEVLTVDLRGRGRSAWDSNPAHYQLPTYIQDAWSLLESRGLKRVLVVGTSLGALMGMVMAAMQPERMAGVVLNDAGPEFDPAGVRRIAAYAGKLPAVSSWAEAAAQARRVYGLALPGLTDAQWLDYARCGYRENAAGVPVPDMDPKIAEAFNNPSAAPADLWPLYAQIKGVPLLVIRGALSDLLSASTLQRMAREKPDLQHLTVANRGHTPLLNEPECLVAIDAFVARHGEGPRHED
ncbi:MAG TPA: alpha/beta hydrolase [Steroidobacteraceae bacterium]|jgi:pimeloyl-ACP methyl ester carboxylesterase|nr:alpha/beta hydrolase [Steroidobacteraceae bacterium]